MSRPPRFLPTVLDQFWMKIKWPESNTYIVWASSPEAPHVEHTWDLKMGHVTTCLLPALSFTVCVIYTIGVSPFLRQKEHTFPTSMWLSSLDCDGVGILEWKLLRKGGGGVVNRWRIGDIGDRLTDLGDTFELNPEVCDRDMFLTGVRNSKPLFSAGNSSYTLGEYFCSGNLVGFGGVWGYWWSCHRAFISTSVS